MLAQFRELNERRRKLGMTYAALAKRSRVSTPTVVRILSGDHPMAGFEHVRAIAEALGMRLIVKADADEADFRRMAARRKAEQLVRYVQGTSGLEGQAVDGKALKRMVERTTHELASSTRKLWSE